MKQNKPNNEQNPQQLQLMDRQIAQLTQNKAECQICFDRITRRTPIWSCKECFGMIHLKCVKEWRNRSTQTEDDSVRLSLWGCPLCRCEYSIAPKYTCFCEKMKKPQNDPHTLPHSCGEKCGKMRGNGCPHPCNLYCHPGPCPPCSALGPTKSCHCGGVAYRARCGSNEPVRSCGRICGKPLSCGVEGHICQDTCHAGPCKPCPENVVQKCYCGKHERSTTCGDGRLGKIAKFSVKKDDTKKSKRAAARSGNTLLTGVSTVTDVDGNTDTIMMNTQLFLDDLPPLDKVMECLAVGPVTKIDTSTPLSMLQQMPMSHNEHESNQYGWYACEDICELKLDCGLHTCRRGCHAGKCGVCKQAVSLVKTCPCGKATIDVLQDIQNLEPRSICTDPIPTCGDVCLKRLPCDHACKMECHEGPCKCSEDVVLVCRCMSQFKVVSCNEYEMMKENGEEYFCDRGCGKPMTCGNHSCDEPCCSHRLTAQRKAQQLKKFRKQCKKRLGASHVDDVTVVRLGTSVVDESRAHVCLRRCNNLLNCRVHRCDRFCHTGPCYPCDVIHLEPLVCNCGKSVLPPPQLCGTQVECFEACVQERPCGHKSQFHKCHHGPCPDCTVKVMKPCVGGHCERLVRCFMSDDQVVCGARCGKTLPCGQHTCKRPCHGGDCIPEGTKCIEACEKLRECGHHCGIQCHGSEPCPDIACGKKVDVLCECGNRSLSLSCAEAQNTPVATCDDSCHRLHRLKALADGMAITTNDKGERVLGDKECPYPDWLVGNAMKCCGVTALVKFEAFIKNVLISESGSVLTPIYSKQFCVVVRHYLEGLDIGCTLSGASGNSSKLILSRSDASRMPRMWLSEAVKKFGFTVDTRTLSHPLEREEVELIAEGHPPKSLLLSWLDSVATQGRIKQEIYDFLDRTPVPFAAMKRIDSENLVVYYNSYFSAKRVFDTLLNLGSLPFDVRWWGAPGVNVDHEFAVLEQHSDVSFAKPNDSKKITGKTSYNPSSGKMVSTIAAPLSKSEGRFAAFNEDSSDEE
eukprot:TRINITY_DN2392_c0_g2_i3.p1 TRINITY_DN2392_c0_g2~~TRINITY_DN2392_c0_g2_i3.p1  ORF type:complete len:1024 (-),score=276.08 TRINITY_DN2392_c0_g2_i3:144-3215(-)